MTLSILQQYRDFTYEAESKLVIADREREIIDTELAYLRGVREERVGEMERIFVWCGV